MGWGEAIGMISSVPAVVRGLDEAEGIVQGLINERSFKIR